MENELKSFRDMMNMSRAELEAEIRERSARDRRDIESPHLLDSKDEPAADERQLKRQNVRPNIGDSATGQSGKLANPWSNASDLDKANNGVSGLAPRRVKRSEPQWTAESTRLEALLGHLDGLNASAQSLLNPRELSPSTCQKLQATEPVFR